MRVRGGFTLVEAVATTVVLSVIAAVTLPVVHAAAESFASARDASTVTNEASLAMDQVVRLLREVPAGADAGTVGIGRAARTGVQFVNGRGVSLQGQSLVLMTADGDEAVLCEEVEEFEIRYMGADGSDVLLTPTLSQRFEVSIRTRGFELRSVAMARVRYGT